MKDQYVTAFHELITETTARYGYSLPTDIEAYLVMLLSNYVEQNDFLPKPGFAQNYLQLDANRPQHAKQLGDVCLFVTGVFPEYGKRAGLNITYFSDIGQTSYQVASVKLNNTLFSVLCQHFNICTEVLNAATNKKPQSIWDVLF